MQPVKEIIICIHSSSLFPSRPVCYLPCFPSVSIFLCAPCLLFLLVEILCTCDSDTELHTVTATCFHTHKPIFFFFLLISCSRPCQHFVIVPSPAHSALCSRARFARVCKTLVYWLFSDDAQVVVSVRKYWPFCRCVLPAPTGVYTGLGGQTSPFFTEMVQGFWWPVLRKCLCFLLRQTKWYFTCQESGESRRARWAGVRRGMYWLFPRNGNAILMTIQGENFDLCF